ncbi:hypothetical protein GJR88_05247 [Dietzia sp. DQ12-45-1b]|nr:hypothetical protein GJR88_05247 [Dietzia sp. DQ12-45-1b]
MLIKSTRPLVVLISNRQEGNVVDHVVFAVRIVEVIDGLVLDRWELIVKGCLSPLLIRCGDFLNNLRQPGSIARHS